MAACDVVCDDTDVDWLDKNALLLVLDRQYLKCFFQGSKRLLQVAAFLLLVLRVPAAALRLDHCRLLDLRELALDDQVLLGTTRTSFERYILLVRRVQHIHGLLIQFLDQLVHALALALE